MTSHLNDRLNRAELRGWQRQFASMTDDEIRDLATGGDSQSPLSCWLASQPDAVLAQVAVGAYAGHIPT